MGRRQAVDERPEARHVQRIGGSQPPVVRRRMAGRRQGDGRAAGRHQKVHRPTVPSGRQSERRGQPPTAGLAGGRAGSVPPDGVGGDGRAVADGEIGARPAPAERVPATGGQQDGAPGPAEGERGRGPGPGGVGPSAETAAAAVGAPADDGQESGRAQAGQQAGGQGQGHNRRQHGHEGRAQRAAGRRRPPTGHRRGRTARVRHGRQTRGGRVQPGLLSAGDRARSSRATQPIPEARSRK